jgi:hypothetical protein
VVIRLALMLFHVSDGACLVVEGVCGAGCFVPRTAACPGVGVHEAAEEPLFEFCDALVRIYAARGGGDMTLLDAGVALHLAVEGADEGGIAVEAWGRVMDELGKRSAAVGVRARGGRGGNGVGGSVYGLAWGGGGRGGGDANGSRRVHRERWIKQI